MKLLGKVALVTGASSGIGRAVALYMAEEGADVAINYHSNLAEAEEAVVEAKTFGRKAMAVKADVSSHEEVKKMFAQVTDEFSTMDILVNNAGIGNLMPAVSMKDNV